MRCLCCLSLLLISCTLQAQDSALNNVRSEVRTPQVESKSSSDNSNGSDNYSVGYNSEDTELYQFLGMLGYIVVSSPFTAPAGILGDRYDSPATFITYPYAKGWLGLMQVNFDECKKDETTPSTWERMTSLRASVEEGNNFNGINRLGITFLADTTSRFGIGGGVHFYEENHQNFYDRLAIGDVNVLYRFAQSNKTQFRAGVGTRFLSDQTRTDWGVNFVYGFESFPRQPYSLGAQIETGTLGSAWVFRATGRVGLVWKYSEVYVGYDYLQIGNTVLQGPMVGLRLWF